jgi:hypothetical protein
LKLEIAPHLSQAPSAVASATPGTERPPFGRSLRRDDRSVRGPAKRIDHNVQVRPGRTASRCCRRPRRYRPLPPSEAEHLRVIDAGEDDSSSANVVRIPALLNRHALVRSPSVAKVARLCRSSAVRHQVPHNGGTAPCAGPFHKRPHKGTLACAGASRRYATTGFRRQHRRIGPSRTKFARGEGDRCLCITSICDRIAVGKRPHRRRAAREPTSASRARGRLECLAGTAGPQAGAGRCGP